MSDLSAASVEVKAAAAEVDNAVSYFLAVSRTQQRFVVLHAALKGVGEALQRATKAQRALALVLALDPDLLASDRPLVEEIIEHA